MSDDLRPVRPGPEIRALPDDPIFHDDVIPDRERARRAEADLVRYRAEVKLLRLERDAAFARADESERMLVAGMADLVVLTKELQRWAEDARRALEKL